MAVVGARQSEQGQKWRDHPWSPALFTALGILLAVAVGLLLWGLYRVVSTYFFIFVAAICLSEALWRPKMMLMRVLDFFTGRRWSPRSFMLSRKGMTFLAAVLAVAMASCSPLERACLAGFVGVVFVLDTRVSLIFRVHRWLLTDDDLVALICLIGMLLVAGVGIALPFIGIANESAELASQVGSYSQYIPEFSFAELVKRLGLDGMVRDMGKDYEDVTWYTFVNRTVHDIVQGEFDLDVAWQEFRGNHSSSWEAMQHHFEKFYRESSGMDSVPKADVAQHGAQIFWKVILAITTSLRGTVGLGLSVATTVTDKAIRVCYFLSLLLYFLGRKNSVLQVVLELLGDKSELAIEIQDILSGVFKYPAARMFTRFWSTCALAYAFNVQYLWILSATTMTMSFAPISLGSYPYLVAIPWWLCGNVRGGTLALWLYTGARSCLQAFFSSWVAEEWRSSFVGMPGNTSGSTEEQGALVALQSPRLLATFFDPKMAQEFWLGAAFMTSMLVVHSWLDSVELGLFSVSKHVPPYAIGLTVLLGFEHFGIWALFYCPLLLCAVTLSYRILIKGEFMSGEADEEDEVEDVSGEEDTDKAGPGASANEDGPPQVSVMEEPAAFLQLTRRMARRVSIAAHKVHDRTTPAPPLQRGRSSSLTTVAADDADGSLSPSRRELHRRGTAPAIRQHVRILEEDGDGLRRRGRPEPDDSSPLVGGRPAPPPTLTRALRSAT